MIIHWQDRDWPVDFSDLTMRQAEVIEKFAGQSIGEWLDSLGEKFDTSSPAFLKLLKIVYWLMLSQNGDQTPIEAVDFPLLKFSKAFTASNTVEVPGPAVPPPAQVVAAVPPAAAPVTTSPGLSTPTAGINGAVPAAYRPAQG